jgi:hypothetical protein
MDLLRSIYLAILGFRPHFVQYHMEVLTMTWLVIAGNLQNPEPGQVYNGGKFELFAPTRVLKSWFF